MRQVLPFSFFVRSSSPARSETVHRPAGRAADTVIETDPDTLSRLLGDDKAITKAVNDARLTITGDTQASQRLFDAIRI